MRFSMTRSEPGIVLLIPPKGTDSDAGQPAFRVNWTRPRS
jgi:hypothetical protein